MYCSVAKFDQWEDRLRRKENLKKHWVCANCHTIKMLNVEEDCKDCDDEWGE